MQGKLKIVEFANVNPREKYFVSYNNEIHRVEYLKKDKLKLEHIDKLVSRSDVTPMKLKVIVDKMTCDLFFDDYAKLEDIEDDMTVEGKIKKFKQKASEGDTVIICSLKVVDRHGLYDLSSRYGTVHDINPTHHTILMNKDNMEIRCKRSDYIIKNVYDEQRIFHIPCDVCGE